MPTRSATDRRRTDSRDRIKRIALDVFAERGWEGATLREVADRLEITRPALYYHFPNKEALLASVHEDLAISLDELIQWAEGEPPEAAMRRDLLTRLAELITGTWGPFVRFAQREEIAMRVLSGADGFNERMERLASLLVVNSSVEGRVRARLALNAILMADSRSEALGGTPATRRAATLHVAQELVDSS